MLQRPSDIPDLPGCYRFSDALGRVLYVGKAKSLSQRLKSYFPQDQSALHPRTRAMLAEATDVTWVVLSSETEALLQEANLIRTLDPPFNVKLRADSAYPSITLSAHPIPRLRKTHSPLPSDTSFGPFPSASHAHLLLEAVSLVSGLRPCSDSLLKRHTSTGRPCLLGETGRCAAPCVDSSDYPARVASAKALLSGDFSRHEAELTLRMREAAQTQAFERAASLRDALSAVRALASHAAPSQDVKSAAVVGVASDEIGAAVSVLVFSSGVLLASPSFIVDRAMMMESTELSESMVVSAALSQAFSASSTPPSLVVSSSSPSPEVLAALSDLAGSRVSHRSPKRGALALLLKTAEQNATQTLVRARRSRASDASARRSELEELKSVLSLPAAPLRIECLDVSHLMGRDPVAAFAVLEDGQPRPTKDRVFYIPSQNDDPASIALAVRKRVEAYRSARAKPASTRDPSLSVLPQLLLIDGGPAQLAAASSVLDELNMNIPVVSLAKRLEEVYVPSSAVPLRLPLNSPSLYVLQRARDSAHRLSVKHQRRRRKISESRSVLDDIKGLGPARRTRLLEESGGMPKLKALPRKSYPKWLPSSVADTVFEALHPTAIIPTETVTDRPPKTSSPGS